MRTVSVALSGPPPVIVNGSVNTCIVAMICSTSINSMIGRMVGSVICQIRCHRFEPSSSAAS